jgi:L-serine dehydratase
MRYDSLFDVIGHIMVGPSSSHTAGACRIAYITRQLFGKPIKNANIYLHGSFAETYQGHGTDRAIVAGLLGMAPDDENLRQSFSIAKEKNLTFTISKKNLGKGYHPNSVQLEVADDTDKLNVVGSSIGGGNIIIKEVEGMEAGFNGDNPTLVFENRDVKGVIAKVTEVISEFNLNIDNMELSQNRQKKIALGWIEVEHNIANDLVEKIKQIKDIIWVRALNV